MHRKSFYYRAIRKIASYFNVFVENKDAENIVINLVDEYGYLNTVSEQKSIDSSHQPIPWFTYPAIEYLSQLDLREKRIFEWGSGNSSAFFAKRCKQIISVESDEEWYNYGTRNLLPNQQIFLRNELNFSEAIEEFSSKFDLIIVDSLRRYECALKAIQFLESGGLIILDNSDWYPNTSSLLRKSGNLIEIDMHGFGPINGYSWTTSLYFHRDFQFISKGDRQPIFSKAAICQTAKDDKPLDDQTKELSD
jgi:hypothetical protein